MIDRKKKIAVGARVKIVDQPEWLPAFLAKYQTDKFWEPHVTLKQSCFVDESEISAIKRILEDYFASRRGSRVIPIVFDKILSDPAWPAIMLAAERTKEIMTLQEELVRALGDYRNYAKPELEEYEKNFNPHLTIADRMTPEQNAAAIRELSGGCVVAGEISEIILWVVENPEAQESEKQVNIATYKL